MQVPALVVSSGTTRIEPKPQKQRGSEFAGFWTEQNPAGNKPVELPRLPRNETPAVANKPLELASSGARVTTVDAPKPTEKTPALIAADARQGKPTARLAVDLTPVAAPKHDSEAQIRSVKLSTASQECVLGQGQGSNPARVHSVESFRRQRSVKGGDEDAAIRRVDEASILSSRRSANHSSRSLCQGCLLEETLKCNPPHVLPQPPGSDGVIKDEIFPGNTNRLAQLKLGNAGPRRTEPLSRLSKEPVLGGSCRETRSCGRVSVSRVPTSLPSSPCSSSIDFIRALKSSKESRASKLLRKLKLSGISSRVGDEVGADFDTKSGNYAWMSRLDVKGH